MNVVVVVVGEPTQAHLSLPGAQDRREVWLTVVVVVVARNQQETFKLDSSPRLIE